MPHMEKEITQKQFGWRVETLDAGTCFVPGDAVTVPDYIVPGKEIDASCPDGLFNAFCAVVADHVEGRKIQSIEIVKGYFGRMSAPGYLDCTAWGFNKSVRDMRAELKEYFE